MPSLTSKTFASYFKNLFTFNQATNIGVPSSSGSAVTMQDGAGVDTAISIGKNIVKIKSSEVTGDQNNTFTVMNAAGEAALTVDASNRKVKVGEFQENATTMYKQFGLYDFSPNNSGYHYPLIANTMFIPTGATAFAADNDWGNGVDPNDTLDVSGLTAQENAVAVYWFLHDSITLDEVRYLVTTDGSDTLQLHIEEYILDTTTNLGDLSAGTTLAYAHDVTSDATTIRTGTYSIEQYNVTANKVVVAFVESDSTTDITISISLKYHLL